MTPTGYGSRVIAFVLAPFLFPQSRVVLSHLPQLDEAQGRWKGVVDGPDPLRLLVFGDSTVAGVGVDDQADGLATNLARELAAKSGRGVTWKAIARSGATTGELRSFFLPRAERGRYDVVFLSLGVNDVMHLRRTAQFTRDLEVTIERLRAASPDALIVVAGIPRMERFASLPDPLGTILGARAHRMNVRGRAVIERHPGVVHAPPWPIGTSGFFARDDFHPGAAGYAAWARQAVAFWTR